MVEWNLVRFVVVIDPDAAPVLVRAILSRMASMDEWEAEEELRKLLDVFASDPTVGR